MNQPKILIEGWRGINHSIALVNQNQILALRDIGPTKLFHIDAPFYYEHWKNNPNLDPGFSTEDRRFLDSLQPCNYEEADLVYRIATPITKPRPKARRTMTFIVTEFGLKAKNFVDGKGDIQDYINESSFITTPSKWSRDRLIDWGFPSQHIKIISHGVNKKIFFKMSLSQINDLRKNLGFTDDDFIFLNIGIPTWNKGTDLLIKSFLTLRKKFPNAKLIIKDSENLYGLSANNVVANVISANPDLIDDKLHESIKIIRTNLTKEQLNSLYNLSDVYVSPYRAEGFNLPVLEALASGTRTITTEGGPTDDFAKGIAQLIPSSFIRAELPERPHAAYLLPDFDSLYQLMTSSINNNLKDCVIDITSTNRLPNWTSAAEKIYEIAK